jgi:hypothetical protein
MALQLAIRHRQLFHGLLALIVNVAPEALLQLLDKMLKLLGDRC